MRTTIDIPDLLFKRAKKAAAEAGIPMRDVVLRALRSHLDAAVPAAGYTFDWQVFPGPWNHEIPVHDNAALLEFLDPIERYLPPAPPERE